MGTIQSIRELVLELEEAQRQYDRKHGRDKIEEKQSIMSVARLLELEREERKNKVIEKKKIRKIRGE